MSQNKVSLKNRVLMCGGGERKVVLDYESCLVYQYEDPSNVTAVYESGRGWIVRDQPYYNSGGWGRGSSGDAEGYYLISNTTQLLRSIEATVYEINSKIFLNSSELKELTKSIAQHNKLVKQQNELAKKMGENRLHVDLAPSVPEFKLRLINKGKTAKGVDAIKTAQTFETALGVFLNQKGAPVKVDNYRIEQNKITQDDKTVAFRDATGAIFMNSEVLQLTKFERNFMGSQSMVQNEINKIAKYKIPFNILAAANLKLNETRIIDQGPESTHQIKEHSYSAKTIERHFTGALLLENAGRKFLMDIDRQEIEYGIFNAFFVEVNPSANTILEAYETMKPDEVKEAEKKGLTVKRQGEWFFIETDKTLTVKTEKVLLWYRSKEETQVVLRHDISHGKGRPNSLYRPVGFGDLDTLVCGTVTHSGREHQDLDLGQKENETDETTTFALWQVIGNTTVGNFTITGDID